jgi:hypothetical protein
MKKIILIVITIVFSGCSSIVHQYNKDRVFVGSYEKNSLSLGLKIGDFKYLPAEGIKQNEFLLIGMFSDTNRAINTNISTIVKNEVKKFTQKYMVNSDNTKCVLNGEIYELSWNGNNGDTKSTINYILTQEDKVIDKIEITHIWTQGLFTIRTIPQKLSFSIHGNIDSLIKNSNFIETFNKYCK